MPPKIDVNVLQVKVIFFPHILPGTTLSISTALVRFEPFQVTAPNDFQGSVIGGINRRTGIIQNTDMSDDGSGCVIHADVPLAQVGISESYSVHACHS